MARHGDRDRKRREALEQHHGRVRGRVLYAVRKVLGRA